MRILITGADGFIGKHAQKIFTKDTTTLCIRNNTTVLELGHLGWKTFLYPAIPTGTEVIIHLAGSAFGNWEECITGNVITTLDVLTIMEKKKIPYLIYLSGAAVYGNVEKPVKETQVPNPTTPYGASKLIAETIIKTFVASKKIQGAIVLRCNNVYGPGSDHGMMSNFIKQASGSSFIEVDGDGSQIREPVYVDDVVGALKLASESIKPGFALYNVSGSEAKSIKEIISDIGKVIGKNIEVKLSGKPAGLPHTLKLDISNIQNALGWKPTTNLVTGISKTLLVQ